MPKREMIKPKPRLRDSRASVCQWKLRFMFLLKEQCEEFITAYLKQEIPLDFSFKEEMTDNSNIYVIQVEGSWANNLSEVGRLLEAVDHGGQ